MKQLRKFFGLMFSEWGSGLSGPASVPFAILTLFATGTTQKIVYALLAIALGFFSAYRIWLKENERSEAAAKEADELKARYFDERPQVGLVIHGPKGPIAWNEAPATSDSCWFWLHQVNGRNATSVRFDPIQSAGGKFILMFDPVPFLDPPRQAPLRYRITEVGAALLNAHELERIGDIEFRLLSQFLDDSPPDALELGYSLRVRYRDINGEELVTAFTILFDKNVFALSVEVA